MTLPSRVLPLCAPLSPVLGIADSSPTPGSRLLPSRCMHNLRTFAYSLHRLCILRFLLAHIAYCQCCRFRNWRYILLFPLYLVLYRNTKTPPPSPATIRKPSPQTGPATARVEITEIDTTTLRSKHAGKESRAGMTEEAHRRKDMWLAVAAVNGYGGTRKRRCCSCTS